MFDTQEILFYKTWISDLDRLNYKWPQLTSQKLKSETIKIVYKSIEHSSNANSNEMSLTIMNQVANQLKQIENYCGFKLNEIQPCKFEGLVLITTISTAEEFKYLNSIVGVYFPYLIVCYSNNEIENFLGIYFFTLVKGTFKKCVNTSFNMGFKQQRFLIVKNIKKFKFWNLDQVKFEKQNSLDLEDSELISFMQKNVVNGYATLNLQFANNSICDKYRDGKLLK